MKAWVPYAAFAVLLACGPPVNQAAFEKFEAAATELHRCVTQNWAANRIHDALRDFVRGVLRPSLNGCSRARSISN